MSEAPKSAKHHYIPVFYLKWWAGDDGCSVRYTKPTPQKIMMRRAFPSETGFLRDLYLAHGSIFKDQQWLENRFFQRIDSDAAAVFSKLNRASPPQVLSAEDMTALSLFIRSLVSRTPSSFERYMEEGRAQWLRTIDNLQNRYDELKGDGDPATYAEYRARHTPELVNDLVLRTLPSTLLGERVGAYLNSMPKRWLHIPDSAPKLLISDAVLLMTNGLKVEGGHYALPLSPSRLLIGADQQSTLDAITAMPRATVVKAVNRSTVERARHFVAAPNMAQDRFIRNRFGNAVS